MPDVRQRVEDAVQKYCEDRDWAKIRPYEIAGLVMDVVGKRVEVEPLLREVARLAEIADRLAGGLGAMPAASNEADASMAAAYQMADVVARDLAAIERDLRSELLS